MTRPSRSSGSSASAHGRSFRAQHGGANVSADRCWHSYPPVRLYEIDLITNRTLVYGTLTATLALVYFGGVATTQLVFRALTGQ
jgi:hypothetical protein